MFDYEVGKSNYIGCLSYWHCEYVCCRFSGYFCGDDFGFTIGIMRLSDNLVFRWICSLPLLKFCAIFLCFCKLFFWYFAVLRAMPSKREKLELIPGVAGVNITGLYLPAPVAGDGFIYSVIALIVAIGL